MTHSLTSTSNSAELSAARARNESIWRASATALYTGDIEEFLSYWTTTPRYRVAYPIDGFPPVVEGRDQFRALFGGFAAAAERIEVHAVRFHQTDDPNIAIVEERMTADLRNGHHYENLLIIRVTFLDGLLDDMFEYYGQIAHQKLANNLST